MSEHLSFMHRVLSGDVLEPDEEIDTAIAEWHGSDTGMKLHEWLGITESEYELLMTKPSTLRLIIQAHRWGDPGYLDVEKLPELPMAARSTYSAEIEKVREWLRQTGRA